MRAVEVGGEGREEVYFLRGGGRLVNLVGDFDLEGESGKGTGTGTGTYHAAHGILVEWVPADGHYHCEYAFVVLYFSFVVVVRRVVVSGVGVGCVCSSFVVIGGRGDGGGLFGGDVGGRSSFREFRPRHVQPCPAKVDAAGQVIVSADGEALYGDVGGWDAEL